MTHRQDSSLPILFLWQPTGVFVYPLLVNTHYQMAMISNHHVRCESISSFPSLHRGGITLNSEWLPIFFHDDLRKQKTHNSPVAIVYLLLHANSISTSLLRDR